MYDDGKNTMTSIPYKLSIDNNDNNDNNATQQPHI